MHSSVTGETREAASRAVTDVRMRAYEKQISKTKRGETSETTKELAL